MYVSISPLYWYQRQSHFHNFEHMYRTDKLAKWVWNIWCTLQKSSLIPLRGLLFLI